MASFANSVKLLSGAHPFQEETIPTRNVNLTDELDRFVAAKIESGRYDNASEVVRAAPRSGRLERDEHEHEAKLVALRAAINEGDAGGIAEGDSLDNSLLIRQRSLGGSAMN